MSAPRARGAPGAVVQRRGRSAVAALARRARLSAPVPLGPLSRACCGPRPGGNGVRGGRARPSITSSHAGRWASLPIVVVLVHAVHPAPKASQHRRPRAARCGRGRRLDRPVGAQRVRAARRHVAPRRWRRRRARRWRERRRGSRWWVATPTSLQQLPPRRVELVVPERADARHRPHAIEHAARRREALANRRRLDTLIVGRAATSSTRTAGMAGLAAGRRQRVGRSAHGAAPVAHTPSPWRQHHEHRGAMITTTTSLEHHAFVALHALR